MVASSIAAEELELVWRVRYCRLSGVVHRGVGKSVNFRDCRAKGLIYGRENYDC